MTRSGSLDRIDVLLSGITDPKFTAVIRAEPLAISGTPVLAYWMQSRANDWRTLNNIGSITTVLIRGYFRLVESTNVRESVEADLWDAAYQIDTVLRSDANLADNCTDSNVGSATFSTEPVGSALYRAVSVPFEIMIYEDVSITP
jgi:hypothetical protein